MKIKTCILNSFTFNGTGGNPAGVVIDERITEEKDMLSIAKHINLSETAFVRKIDKSTFNVRFFTPECEVDLCGHATVAAFYLLGSIGYIERIKDGIVNVYQITKAGKLSIEIVYKDYLIENVFMEQAPPKETLAKISINEIANSLNINLDDFGLEKHNIYPKIISTGIKDIIIPVKNREILNNIIPDYSEITRISKKYDVCGMHVFCIDDINSVSCRNFAPLVGINEESATGTSNGALIYYLKKNKVIENNYLISKQGEAMNELSEIHCIIKEKYNVWVGGRCSIISEIFIEV